MKKNELVGIRGCRGCYVATILEYSSPFDAWGHYKEYSFLWYPKKEVIYKLRHEHNCVVGREWC